MPVDVEKLREQVGAVSSDPALDPAERVTALRKLRDLVEMARDQARQGLRDQLELVANLTTVLGQADSYIGSQEAQREATAMDRALAMAQMRENADLREQLASEGIEPERLDALGLMSHDEMDMREADGTLEEQEAFGLAAHFKESLVRRKAGKFAEKFGAPKAPKGRGGQKVKGAAAPKAPAVKPPKGPGLELRTPKPTGPQTPGRYEVPTEAPKAPKSPGTKEAVARIKALPDVSQQLQEVEQYGLNDWPEKGEVAQRLFGDAKDSQHFHTRPAKGSPGTKEGTAKRSYTPERKVVHDAIIGHFLHTSITGLLGADHPITAKLSAGQTLDDAEKQTIRDAAEQARGGGRARALFMAGGPASGKTSALKASPELEPDNAVTINPDEMKDRLPEYREMIEGADRFAASGVHEESSDLGKRLQSEALDLGLNIVVDGTGDSKPGKFAGKMQDMDAKDYDVSALYVTIPTDDAVVRATTRAMKSGRWVPEPELRSQHKNVSGNFEEVAALPFLKDLKLYDNTNPDPAVPPVLIAEVAEGKVHTTHDQTAYQTFLDKAKEGGEQ